MGTPMSDVGLCLGPAGLLMSTTGLLLGPS